MKKKQLFLLFVFIIFLGFIFYLFQTIKEGMQNNYTAIIVEPREHKALYFVLENALTNLDENWTVVILHGTQNKEYLENLCNHELKDYKSRIKMHNLQVKNLSLEDYNQLLTSKHFYDYIPSEHFLIFQTDSIICKSFNNYIYNFLQFDYVGAPHKNWVGNGGLSLRKKSKMLEVLHKDNRKENENEDVFFTKKEHELKLPDVETANKFSNEGLYSDDSFGVHKPWWYLNEDELRKKDMNCPGLNKLIELNK